MHRENEHRKIVKDSNSEDDVALCLQVDPVASASEHHRRNLNKRAGLGLRKRVGNPRKVIRLRLSDSENIHAKASHGSGRSFESNKPTSMFILEGFFGNRAHANMLLRCRI